MKEKYKNDPTHLRIFVMAVVVAQLIGRSLTIPEVCGSNPKTKIKKKEAGNGPFFKKMIQHI